MEVGCHQFGNPFRTVNNLTAQLSIVESTQLGNDTIYHSWREHPILFENGTLTLQAVSRSRTGIRQLGQLLQLGGILGVVAADEMTVVLEQADVTLALYEPSISEEGVLSLGAKRTSGVITTELKAGEPLYITAIVFLNGDTLSSGAVSATQHPSLYGTVNLQFSSSAVLTPMNYTDYAG